MPTKPLPMIPRKYIKKNGRVDVWDMEVENGPAKIEFTTMLAREALQRDEKRYKLELPRGMKPGQLQLDNEERAAADAEAANVEPADPVYGRTPA